jgi:hypothetical protein
MAKELAAMEKSLVIQSRLMILDTMRWNVSALLCPPDISDSYTVANFLGLTSTSLVEVQFDGRLRDNNSIYRMPPSPAVDAAWDEVSAEGFEAMTVPASMVVDSKKDPDMSLKAPSAWGYGDDAYVVQVDVFHQIHCLNELRKEIYYDHYYAQPPSALHRDHKSHCIHMLLQSLMCHADLDIITHNWVHNDHISDPKERPFPDFNMVKQCRDFNATLRWAKDNAIKDLSKVWNALRIPPGMKTVPGDGYA